MNKTPHILIIGGGLAGLSLAILCAKSGFSITVLEKGDYPKHKVCGEYISMESYGFLQSLGLPLDELNLPKINNFVLTSHHHLQASCHLEMGGFGVSRYFLDEMLAKTVAENGGQVLANQRVTAVDYDNQLRKYRITTHTQTAFVADFVVGAFGRVSGLQPQVAKADYIGVKYHLADGPAADTIEIHNFEGGYCGISQIENGRFCLCYLAKAEQLKAYKGDIAAFEAAVLAQNPYLKTRLASEKLMKAVTTSQLNFGVAAIENLPYPCIGDAAGFIPPITGNGMSLAFRAAKILHNDIIVCLNDENPNKIHNLLAMNKKYRAKYLNFRIKQGIFLQKLLFLKLPFFNKLLMFTLTNVPFLMRLMTRQAVGKKIV